MQNDTSAIPQSDPFMLFEVWFAEAKESVPDCGMSEQAVVMAQPWNPQEHRPFDGLCKCLAMVKRNHRVGGSVEHQGRTADLVRLRQVGSDFKEQTTEKLCFS